MDLCGQGGNAFSLVWIAALIAVFYFMMIRPQSKRAKEHQGLIGGLKKGDNIVLNSGIYGSIVGLSENVATVEIAEKVRIRVAKTQIAGYSKDADKALEQADKR
ncbi:MAG: preprotein translocase subunit YajC [Candidatus Alcyoniella australis]|nr:preprotein translocase subunit YajC [Candidatus Alcyoniella australis]